MDPVSGHTPVDASNPHLPGVSAALPRLVEQCGIRKVLFAFHFNEPARNHDLIIDLDGLDVCCCYVT